MKKYYKNVNLSDKQSQTSVQESENVNLGDKKSLHSVKRHKNVNLSDKKGQISKIKSDKSVQKVTKSHKL